MLDLQLKVLLLLFIKSDTEVKKLSEGGGGSSGGNVTLAGTPDYITISNQEITRNQIDLANDVTGVLPSANLDSDTAHLSGTQTFSDFLLLFVH